MISKLTRKAVEEFLKTGERLDGRGFDDYRKISVEKPVSIRAEGSAMVSLGNTKVAVGVKLDVLEPFPDEPEKGVLITNAELTPLSNEDFEPGPPGEDAIELARVVDRAIREAEVIDLEKLCISPGEAVWGVFVDIYTINADGNLFDAASLAAMIALKNAFVPKYEDGMVIREEKAMDLPLKNKVATVTFAKLGNAILVDPTELEEKLMEARFTVGMSTEGIHAMQKGGVGGFTFKEIEEMIERARKHTRKLLSHVR